MKILDYKARIQALGTCAAVGISGLDGAGKTTFAKQLAKYLKAEGIAATLLHIDDFNNYEIQKRIYDAYMDGDFTKEHFDTYFHESIEYEAAVSAILQAKMIGLVIVEGVFLFKPQLNHLFDLRFLIDTPADVARTRFVMRKQEVGDLRPVEVFDDIWLPAFKRYMKEGGDIVDIDFTIKND